MRTWKQRVVAAALALAALGLSGCTSMQAYKWQVQARQIGNDWNRYMGVGPEFP